MSFLNSAVGVIVYWLLSKTINKDPYSIVFGSWKGESFSDNSRYLAEYIAKVHPEYKLYWVGKKNIQTEVEASPAHLVFLEKDRFFTNIKVMQCKYCFVSQKYHLDISKYNLVSKAVRCYLHHGTPVKKWGDDGLNKAHSLTVYEKIYNHLTGKGIDYDYFVSSSPLNDRVLCSAMKSCGCSPEKILHTGTPRNDLLLSANLDISEIRKKYLQAVGAPEDVLVILYLPTYRRTNHDVFSFHRLADDQHTRLSSILSDHHAIILEKSHFAASDYAASDESELIYHADKSFNVQEMLLFADILISDYSGAFLDYSLLDKPIVHFAYDYEYYRDVDSGLYYDIEDFSAGAVAYSFEELCDALKNELNQTDMFRRKRLYVRQKYMEYERGHASEQIFNEIISNQ